MAVAAVVVGEMDFFDEFLITSQRIALLADLIAVSTDDDYDYSFIFFLKKYTHTHTRLEM